MAEKSYNQMKQEFRELYFSEIKPLLPKFNEERKKGSSKIIAFWFVFYSVFSIVVCSILWSKLALFLFPLPFIGMGILIYLTRNDKKNRDGSITIKADFEMDLKIPLMKKLWEFF